MIKFIFLLLVVLSSCYPNYEFVEPPEFEVIENGNAIILNWKHAKGTDIAGYMIYWGEITDYRNIDVGIVNGYTHQINVGYQTQYKFTIKKGKFYQFYLKSYDIRGNFSFASEERFYPYNPIEHKISSRIDDPWHGYLYKTGNEVKLAWSESQNSDYYELKMEFINDPNMITTYDFSTTTDLFKTIQRPSGVVGICKFFVRACNQEGCSEWTDSDGTNALVTIDGQQQAGNWLLYWMLQAPTWE